METKEIMQHLYGKTYKEVVDALSVHCHEGDCCGWSDYEVVDYVKEIEGSENSVLKSIVQIEYGGDESDRTVVNFVFDIGGGDGVILGYDMSAGSGSGWAYGASCSLMYGDEVVSGASW